MIADHANPAWKPTKTPHPAQLSCRECAFVWPGLFAETWAREPWACPDCGAHNPGTRQMRASR